MYQVDERDKVKEIKEAPQCDVGAPAPSIDASEHHLQLSYLMESPDATWDPIASSFVANPGSQEPVAVIEFTMPYAHMFGPPNDEAFEGHPLAKRGLEPYGVYEVINSSWIRSLERMNSVHRYHDPERFTRYRHFIFAFHDSTFECIAEGFEISVYDRRPENQAGDSVS